MRETKEEFETGYLRRSGMTEEKLRKTGLVVVPCACEERSCRGWRMAYKDAYQLAQQLEGLPLVL